MMQSLKLVLEIQSCTCTLFLTHNFINNYFFDNNYYSLYKGDLSASTASTAPLLVCHNNQLGQTPSPVKVVRVNVGNSTLSHSLSINNLESMQRSVMNAFALKYSK